MLIKNSFIKPEVIKNELLRAKICKKKATPGYTIQVGSDIQSIDEKWSAYPHRLFFYQIKEQLYFGQKLISPLVLEHNSPSLFCSEITAEMLLGPVLQIQTSEQGVEIYYKPLDASVRHSLFASLKNDPLIDIYFPFAYLMKESHKEITSPPKGWVVDESTAHFLALGEQAQRQVSIELLKKDQHPTPIIYDPACSTGKFLHALKQAVPTATVIGQELSVEMCTLADSLLDKVIYGDSLYPGVPEEYCDYIFFRFLNAEVVTTAQAKSLFDSIMRCLKPKGKAILFGFTPVLMTTSYILKKKFRILGCTAAVPEKNSLIQYYIIQK